MTSVTICPGCQRQVLVPPDTNETALVACPLCSEEFVLSGSIPEDAPALKIVNAGVESELEPEPEAEGSEFGALQETVTVDEEMSAGDELPDFEQQEEQGEEDEEDEQDEQEEHDEQDEEFQFASDESEDGDQGELFYSEQEASAAVAGPDEDAGPATATVTRKAPRKGKTKKIGIKTQMAGVVIFGIIGLGLGYGILKMIKPAAAKPIDAMLADALSPITSLWSSGESASDGEESESAPMDDGDDFKIGGALQEDEQATHDDMDQLADSADFGFETTSTASDGNEGQDEAQWTPEADDQPSGPAKRFAALLNDQPDEAGVIESVDISTLKDAVDKTRAMADDDDGQIKGSFYLGLCDLGHKVAFAPPDDQVFTELSRSEAAALVRKVSSRRLQARLSGFGVDMLFSEKRPRDKKGIFLVGKTQIITQYGDLFATEIKIGKLNKQTNQKTIKRVVVLSEERPEMNVQQMAGVLGAVVRDPQAKLPGYDPQDDAFSRFEADDTLLVLAGVVTALPED